MPCALIEDLLGRSLRFPPGSSLLPLLHWLLFLFFALCAIQHLAATGLEQRRVKEGDRQGRFSGPLSLSVLFSFFFFFLGIVDAVEKAEKTAGLILLPQAGMQTKNNVTAGNAITPV